MAQRRMFSKDITGADAFLEMPASTQLLYFHLGMEADDDGFIGSPKKISRMIGSGDDDLKILIAKRFVLSFPTGVVVIKHWKLNNYIQSDRYRETKYLDEKKALITKENGSYTECIQEPNKMDTQVRIGKVSLGEDIIIGIRDYWNSLKVFPGDVTDFKNIGVKERLLPECRKITPDIEETFKKLIKKGYTDEDFRLGVKKYVGNIINRDPNNDFSNHRFSLYEFFTQKNGFIKFLN